MLLVKGEKGQQLSEWETNAINTDEVVGLLHVDARKKGFAYQLEFDITGYITFQEFLQIPLTQETFARVLDNILETLKSIDEKHFNPQLVLYDMDKIYINPSTQRLFFAYVPLQPFENNNTLQSMLLDIIQYSAFDDAEDSEYVSEYISILNRGINFSLFDLEEYVRRLIKTINGEYDGDTVECPKCHSMVSADAVLCKCGFKLHGFTGSTNVATSQVYDMFQSYTDRNGSKSASSANSDVCSSSRISREPERQEPLPADPVPEKPKKKKQTTVLSLYDEEEDSSQAFLIQESTEEKILIDRDPFRLGRESGDHIVSNRYVSDPHLDILSRNGRYYAIDLGSTNKTYIDGVVLMPQQETELFSGCLLKLANEKFQFIIE